MTGSALRALALVLLLPAVAAAHRLDEYLQAARIAVSSDGVDVELDLTPGVNIAPAIADRVDRDGNGAISAAEAEAYGRAVLEDLDLSVDGRGVLLRLAQVDAPPIGDMLEGVGTIRLVTHADVAAASSRMAIRFANRHAAGQSVYLVNALQPLDRRLVLERQSRDAHQRTIDLDYAVGSGRTGAAAWSLLAVSLALGLFWLRA